MHIQSPWSIRIPGISRNLSVNEVESIKEKSKSAFFFVVGAAVIASEWTLRKSTDVVSDVAVAMADTHKSYVDKVRSSAFLHKAISTVEPRTTPVVAID
jgi:hypothetical protein